MLSFLLIVSPPFLLSTHVLASVERFLQAPRPLPHASWPPEAALHPEGGATQPRLVWGSLSHKKVISADLPWPWEPEVWRLACPQPGGRARAPEGSLSHTPSPDQPGLPQMPAHQPQDSPSLRSLGVTPAPSRLPGRQDGPGCWQGCWAGGAAAEAPCGRCSYISPAFVSTTALGQNCHHPCFPRWGN